MTQRNKEYLATMELLLAIDFDVARPASEHVLYMCTEYQPQLIVLILFFARPRLWIPMNDAGSSDYAWITRNNTKKPFGP